MDNMLEHPIPLREVTDQEVDAALVVQYGPEVLQWVCFDLAEVRAEKRLELMQLPLEVEKEEGPKRIKPPHKIQVDLVRFAFRRKLERSLYYYYVLRTLAPDRAGLVEEEVAIHTVAEILGVAVSTVKKHVSKLIQLRWVSRKQFPNGTFLHVRSVDSIKAEFHVFKEQDYWCDAAVFYIDLFDFSKVSIKADYAQHFIVSCLEGLKAVKIHLKANVSKMRSKYSVPDRKGVRHRLRKNEDSNYSLKFYENDFHVDLKKGLEVALKDDHFKSYAFSLLKEDLGLSYGRLSRLKHAAIKLGISKYKRRWLKGIVFKTREEVCEFVKQSNDSSITIGRFDFVSGVYRMRTAEAINSSIIVTRNSYSNFKQQVKKISSQKTQFSTLSFPICSVCPFEQTTGG